MCKVFAMSNMSKVKVTKKFLNAVKTEVCRTGDKHGFGYAVVSEDGKIAGERTMRPMQWQPLQGDPMKSRTGSLPIVLKTRNQFGELVFDKPKAFIGHGRYSTNDVSIENTHPYASPELALIHNGVVRDPDKSIRNLTTTNDTEILFRCWEQGGMAKVESTVTGYYAMAILDAAGLLHIVRDDQAMLYIAYSRTVDSYIFATTADIIKTVAKKMQWNIEAPEELIENMYVVFDRNEIIKQQDFEKRWEPSTGLTAAERAAFGDGDSREYSGSKTSSGLSDNARYNAWQDGDTYETWNQRNERKAQAKLDAEADDEPSYREGVRERQAQAKEISEQDAFVKAAQEGESERQFIDDGAPNTGFGYDESSYPTNGIDEHESAYQDAYNTDKRKIS